MVKIHILEYSHPLFYNDVEEYLSVNVIRNVIRKHYRFSYDIHTILPRRYKIEDVNIKRMCIFTRDKTTKQNKGKYSNTNKEMKCNFKPKICV